MNYDELFLIRWIIMEWYSLLPNYLIVSGIYTEPCMTRHGINFVQYLTVIKARPSLHLAVKTILQRDITEIIIAVFKGSTNEV